MSCHHHGRSLRDPSLAPFPCTSPYPPSPRPPLARHRLAHPTRPWVHRPRLEGARGWMGKWQCTCDRVLSCVRVCHTCVRAAHVRACAWHRQGGGGGRATGRGEQTQACVIMCVLACVRVRVRPRRAPRDYGPSASAELHTGPMGLTPRLHAKPTYFFLRRGFFRRPVCAGAVTKPLFAIGNVLHGPAAAGQPGQRRFDARAALALGRLNPSQAHGI
jgi:hypothetical protein